MFATLLPLFASASTLLPAATPAAANLPLPIVAATLSITPAGNGTWLVVISGRATAPNAAVGVRVKGDDPVFDDHLFSIIGTARTDALGNFVVSRVVHRSILNEDPEGTDEIYAIADVTGAGSGRTNTISRSF